MNLDEAYSTFKSNVLTAMDDCSTSRRPSTRKKLYMNRSAMQLRKKKKELWSIYCKSMDILDHSRFVRCRNKLRSLTRKLRKDHEAKLAKNMKHRPKAFWRYAHSRLKTKCRVEDLLDENGLLVNDSQRKAEVLNHFFSSVFTDEGPEAPPTLPCNYQGPLLEDVDVSPQKVEAKLSSLKPSSAVGPDAIQPRLLKESANILASPLSVLFRKSLDSGKIPSDSKLGDVVPIYKKGDRRIPASYRPSSLTAVPSKVLESIIRDQLLQHFTANGLLHEAQHGFLPKRSCSS